ncbi:Gfo/Idh/MocA family protein [Teichococcus vastitatis]|uniref:Gfo/Idh/MocA family oxidoreductase n=1 Tax=Teichococcus vastitatis TaxID=2307076 RepID=A0ABS9W8E2_9PROT|nr:Gfo/Idh/MocA family oxidoreductase [Pseudoroseomonas vastitatis]MCI0755570.1 Gfo/Idh/MocA family oxidoreductase [Pseudoroseomonas vastitatis]
MSLGVGLIGLGMAAKPHMLALRDLEAIGAVSIIGGYSPSADRRCAFAAQWNAPIFKRQDALLNHPDLGLVLVLTPPGTHLPIAEAVAAAGRHMIVEKPLEISARRGEALAVVAEAAGVLCGVCLQHRFRPAALRLKQALDVGEIGRVLSASASIRWWRDAAYFAEPGRGTLARDGGGVLLTQAIHTLDLLLHLAGPHRSVAAFAMTSPLRTIDTEDVVAAAIQFESGAIGALDATTVARPGYPERIEIAGTEGSALLEGSRLTLHGRDGPETVGAALAGGSGADPMAFDHGPHRALLEEMALAIAQERRPINDARSAIPVQRLIEDLLADAERPA